MPSSTSNFDSASRAPTLKWNRVWIGTLFLVIVMVLSAEAFWRATGHRASVVDDPSLWSYHRNQVSDAPSQVVLLGTSRMQLGFSTNTFYERFPSRPLAVLCIAGSYGPIATLRDLSEDESFRGTVICGATVSNIQSGNWHGQQAYVDHFHNSWPNQHLEPALRSWWQSRLVVLNPNVSAIQVVTEMLRNGRLPMPHYVVETHDRSRQADYSMATAAGAREARIASIQKASLATPRHSFESWSLDVAAVRSFVQRIKERGGIVVFVRFPTTDEHWQATEERRPKRVYWDQLERLTGANTIHFTDVPTLSRFDCPDTSHLDYRDSPKFTAALLDELVKQRILSDDQNL